jgi:hypothetical protein
MIGRFVLTLSVLASFLIDCPLQGQNGKAQPPYVSVKLCDIPLRHGRSANLHVSVDAEYVSAIPHGLFLRDRGCPTRVLQLDFGDTDLDPSVAFVKKYMWQIHEANGTFRGVLKRDPVTGRRKLWLQSVVNFQPADYIPELHLQEPILPDPPCPNGRPRHRPTLIARTD